MQLDLFSMPVESVKPGELILKSTTDSGYRYRTGVNATKADLTLAVALDFTTAGELLTKKLAGNKYVAIKLGASIDESIAVLKETCRKHNVKVLNVAGNGIYTLAKHGWTQARVNQWLYEVLRGVVETWPLEVVRSGGQTGLDTAGLVAGIKLGLSVEGLYPNGFLRRGENNKDYRSDEAVVREELLAAASLLK